MEGSNPVCDVEFWHHQQPAHSIHLDHYTMKANIKRFIPDAHIMQHYTLKTDTSPHVSIIKYKLSFLTLVLMWEEL